MVQLSYNYEYKHNWVQYNMLTDYTARVSDIKMR